MILKRKKQITPPPRLSEKFRLLTVLLDSTNESYNGWASPPAPPLQSDEFTKYPPPLLAFGPKSTKGEMG